MKKWLEWTPAILGIILLTAILGGIVYVVTALSKYIIDGVFGDGVTDKVSIFIGMGLYTYLITQPIKEAIWHLENVINRLDKRVEKLENPDEWLAHKKKPVGTGLYNLWCVIDKLKLLYVISPYLSRFID